MVTYPDTSINMIDCELMGNDTNHTAGCIFMNSNVSMSLCKLTSYRQGAIFSIATDENIVQIRDCEISKSSLVGIYTQGEGAEQLICRTNIELIDGPGIKV